MRLLYLLIVNCFLLSNISCAPAVAPEIGFKSVATKGKIIYTRVKGERWTLSKYLKIVKEFSKYDDNGLFSGVVVFNNNRYAVKKSPQLAADVQFVFLDKDGVEIEKTNWQPVIFPPGVDVVVKQVSMNSDTRDYRVYVRGPRAQNW